MDKASCHNEMKVIFGHGQGEKTLGKIIKLNRVTAKVQLLESRSQGSTPVGTVCNVSYQLLEAAPENVTSARDAPEVTAVIAQKAEERRSLVGTKFRSTYADGNPEWTVIRKSGPNWLCRIEADIDWQGQEKVFMPSEIQKSLAMSSMFTGMQQQNAGFYQSLTPGDTVHYNNGHGCFVRCVVIRQDMENKLKPIAMVGEWKFNDLPTRRQDGSICYNHYPQMMEDHGLFVPNASNIWENRPTHEDPRQLPAIDLSVPDMTMEEERVARKWQKIAEVQQACSDGFSKSDPDEVIASIRLAMAQLPL